MRSLVSAVALLQALALGVVAHAERPMRFEQLGPDDGLAQESANAIAQDKVGFLWIGTEDGLDRYDGYTLAHSRQERGNRKSLPNNFIGGLTTDAQGALWVATDGGGVVHRDAMHGGFIALPLSAQDAAALARVRVLRFDRTGRLWIGTRENGVAVYDEREPRLHLYRHDAGNPASLGDDSIYALLADRGGRIWIGTARGVDRLDPVSTRLTHEASGRRVRALLEDGAGMIWVGMESGLMRIDPVRGARTYFGSDPGKAGALPEGDVNALLEDGEGHLWVGTDNGLAYFDPERQSFDIYRHDPKDPASLPDDQIMSLYEDRGGLLWIGTKFGGLAKWNPRNWSFGHHRAARPGSDTSSNIMAFTEDLSGKMWIAALGEGITILDAQGALAGTLRHEAGASVSISDNKVMTLLTAADGSIWAGTMGAGLNHIAPNRQHVTVYRADPRDPHALSSPGIMSLLEDSAHRIWVGTYGGSLCRFDPAHGNFVRYMANPADSTKLAADRVTALAEDSSGMIWTGTDGGGLHVLDPDTGRFYRFKHDINDPKTLSADTVYSILVDARGTVWVGTRGGGLDRVVGSAREPQKIRFTNLSEAEGLPNTTVYGIRVGRDGMLWLSTNRGLASVDPQKGSVHAFHRNQGLQGEEFNFGAHFVSREGVLYFGGANGYNRFDPRQLKFNRLAPPIVLTSVRQAGQVMRNVVPGGAMPDLNLTTRMSAMTFEFAALDYEEPRANHYQYLLEGVSLGWTDLGTQHSLTHANLGGGHYTLRVRAANADGTWSPPALNIPLKVSPPWWKSLWAFFGYVSFVALMMWLAWFGHRRSLEREARYRRELEVEVRNRTGELAERARELESLNRKLEEASQSDALTGLGNRRALTRAMPQILAAARGAGRMALMVVDLDNLKPINDEHGHESGDRVLADTAALLRASLREGDRVVRWGGDEFVIVRTGVSLDETAAFAEHLREKMARHRVALAGGLTAGSTCSIGFALYPFVASAPKLLSWEQVLHLADLALYRSKTQRNAWAGWCGGPAAATVPDLPAALAMQADLGVKSDYVEWRTSLNSNKSNLLTRAI